MVRFMAALLLGGSLLLSGLVETQATPLYADGQKQTIKGADDAGQTALSYLLMPGLPIFGVLLALSGVGNLGQERGTGKGITKISGGVFSGFLPAFIKPGSDYAQAASVGGAWLPGATWPDIVGTLVVQAFVFTLLYAWYRRTHVAQMCHGI